MLEQSFIVSFICIAIHIIFTWKGMLLKPVGDWLDLRLNKYIKKPLFTCPMCMASYWTLMYWLIIQGEISILTFVMMLTVCGINTLLNTLIYALHESDDEQEIIENDEQYKINQDIMYDIIKEGKMTPEKKQEVIRLVKILDSYDQKKFIENLDTN